jgi:hypothetical protein
MAVQYERHVLGSVMYRRQRSPKGQVHDHEYRFQVTSTLQPTISIKDNWGCISCCYYAYRKAPRLKQDHAPTVNGPGIIPPDTLFGIFAGDADKLKSIATTHCDR